MCLPSGDSFTIEAILLSSITAHCRYLLYFLEQILFCICSTVTVKNILQYKVFYIQLICLENRHHNFFGPHIQSQFLWMSHMKRFKGFFSYQPATNTALPPGKVTKPPSPVFCEHLACFLVLFFYHAGLFSWVHEVLLQHGKSHHRTLSEADSSIKTHNR